MQVSVRDKSSDRCRKIPIIAQGINVIMTVEMLAFYISLSFFMKIKKEAQTEEKTEYALSDKSTNEYSGIFEISLFNAIELC